VNATVTGVFKRNFATFSKDLFEVSTLWFCSAFWYRTVPTNIKSLTLLELAYDLNTKTYMGRLIKEDTDISLHPNNFDKDEEW